jgi:hypothetical protein
MSTTRPLAGRGAALLVACLVVVVVIAGLELAFPRSSSPGGGVNSRPGTVELAGVGASIEGSGMGSVYAIAWCPHQCPENVTVPTTLAVDLSVSVSALGCPPAHTYEIVRVSGPSSGAFSVAQVTGAIELVGQPGSLPISIPYCGASGYQIGGADLTVTLSAVDQGPPVQTLNLSVEVNQAS